MNKIDSPGFYVGEVTEAAVGLTKKGYPQAVLRLKVTQKYVESPDELKHFGMNEPGFQDYSDFDFSDVAYLVLFNRADVFNADSALLNVQQIKATFEIDLLGDGTFDDITALVGQPLSFRVQENEYNGKTSLQVNWIDKPDASPERQLKALDPAEIKSLNAKLQRASSPKPVAAKPAAAKSAPAAGRPVTKTTAPSTPKTAGSPKNAGGAAAAPSAATTAPAAAATNSTPEKSTTKKSSPPKKDADPEEVTVKGLPKEVTQEAGWDFVCEHKGGNSDQDVSDAWIAATNEVGGEKAESDFTTAEWAKVRDIVIKDLSLETK